MTTVNTFVERSIFNYPSLFANRTQVLFHAFIAYGTGICWHEGGLVDMYYERDNTDDEVINVMPEELKRKIGDEWFDARVDASIVEWEQRNESYLVRRHNAAQLALIPGPLSLPLLTPYLDASPYFNVPANVKPDWAAARDEIGAVVEPLYYNGGAVRVPNEIMNPGQYERMAAVAEEIRKLVEARKND